MGNQVKLSVLLLSYNHEKYIKQTLDSIISQKTNFRIKIIIHDDASTDKSQDIINEYISKYPELITGILQEENQFSKGANIFSDFMRQYIEGDYVAYCECDDYWIDEYKLQKQVDFLDTHPDYTACMHNCIMVNQDNEEIDCVYSIYAPYKTHTYSLTRLALNNSFPGQTASKVFRSKYMFYKTKEEEIAVNKLRTNGDVINNLYLLLNGKVYCMEDFMSAYRVVQAEGSSWTAANYGKNLSDKYFISSLDLRNYAKNFYNVKYKNYLVTFHSGLAACIKYLFRPNKENQLVYQNVKKEKRFFYLYLFGMGILSLPQFLEKKLDEMNYRLEK